MRIRNLDELDPVNDGRVLLGTETGIIGKTDGKLSDIIGDAAEAAVSGKVDQDEYNAAMDGINDELDAVDDAISNISANYATTEYVDNEIGKIGSYTVAEGTDEGPTLEPSAASEKVIYLVKDEGVTGTDQYREWIVTENEQEEKVWTCIGDTTIDLSDYALSADVNGELALKEDKVFVAEYGVTTYADIKAAYDAGKQIVCNLYPSKTTLPDFVDKLNLTEYVPMINSFIFAAQIASNEFKYVIVNNNNKWNEEQHHFYDSSATSGTQELTNAFNTKQDTLTAGIDLVLDNGVIGVNTNGTVANSADMSFVAGTGTYASGEGAYAIGVDTSAINVRSFAGGHESIASAEGTFAYGDGVSAQGNYSHAEGTYTIAFGPASHAEGYATTAAGQYSHTEGSVTLAGGNFAHAEGSQTKAYGDYSHAEGKECIASGMGSHAEGCATKASKSYSHAGGFYTNANSDYMTVIGKYNSTISNAAFVVGNGEYNRNHDAFIVDWNGVASATKLATSGINDVETSIKSKLDTTAIQFVSTSAEAVAGTNGVIYIVTGTNA